MFKGVKIEITTLTPLVIMKAVLFPPAADAIEITLDYNKNMGILVKTDGIEEYELRVFETRQSEHRRCLSLRSTRTTRQLALSNSQRRYHEEGLTQYAMARLSTTTKS
jgi:hypothetical protein